MARDGSSGVNFWPHSIADEDKSADSSQKKKKNCITAIGLFERVRKVVSFIV